MCGIVGIIGSRTELSDEVARKLVSSLAILGLFVFIIWSERFNIVL